MKYKKKPIIIEAFKWMYDVAPEWWVKRRDLMIEVQTGAVLIPTLEGKMEAKPGDWIIQGIKGEIYPCKPDIFEATYEKVES